VFFIARGVIEVDAETENRLPLYRRPCCTERVMR